LLEREPGDRGGAGAASWYCGEKREKKGDKNLCPQRIPHHNFHGRGEERRDPTPPNPTPSSLKEKKRGEEEGRKHLLSPEASERSLPS